MIRWCMYCQRFLGERFPYDSPLISHGICDQCDARSERDEPVLEETKPIRELVKQLLVSAKNGDEPSCQEFTSAAIACGLDAGSICVGLLQPLLYQTGLDWQGARMSVAAEHRFTAWCERAFAMLPSAPPPDGPLDLLILSAPGNLHDLGPRMAARVLAGRGFKVDVVVPGLPLPELVELARKVRPRAIGFSCALPTAVAAACELITRLRTALAPDLTCRFVLAGFAFRLGPTMPLLPVEPDIEIVVDLESFGAHLSSARKSPITAL